MKQALQQRLGQSLIMTPQLQQAIRLLQLSTAELSLEIQQALESNMMLEAVEDEHEDGYRSVTSPEVESLPYAETPKAASEVEDVAGAAIAQDIPEELPVDSAWDDVYDASMPQASSGDHAGFEVENQRPAGESLKDHL
ncbi:MAG: RNA polymerase factor sigma-54, partial [Gammaproteobacteria bacterium]